MNLQANDQLLLHSSVSSEEEILIKKLLLTHDPDGRRVDSELLISAMEIVMAYTSSSEVPASDFHVDAIMKNDLDDMEVDGMQESLGQTMEVDGMQESLGQTMYKISHEMLCKFSSNENLHARTMILFDLLGKFTWDAKVSVILAAFATSYGEFWLVKQLYPHNPLAASVAELKQLPTDLWKLKPRFKAMSLLVKKIVEVARLITKFERLPFRHVNLDHEASDLAKSCVYIAAYWIARSTLACSSEIADWTAMKPAKVNSNSTVVSVWQLLSLVNKLEDMCSRLQLLVDLCQKQIETKLQQKLSKIFLEVHSDNQVVLHMLLALNNDSPLKSSSGKTKLGLSQLKDKEVILLVTKPELLPLDALLFLLHQTHDHPHRQRLSGTHEIVWLPISFSSTWDDTEAESFILLSKSLPWYSVRRPWALNSAVVNYIKQEWNFSGEPKMIVLDSNGKITNLNAFDMFLIWGERAYPFSSSREEELWKDQNWSLQLLLDELDPLLTFWVEERKLICIYGGEDREWIKELNTKLQEIRSSGVQIEMLYVGTRNMTDNTWHNLATINDEIHRNVLSFHKLHFFWLRLETIQRSKHRLGREPETDQILEQVSALLNAEDKQWVVFGRGGNPEVLKLEGTKAMECFDKFLGWGDNVSKLGFLKALKLELDPPDFPGPCSHSARVAYEAGLLEREVVCEKCKRVMKKYVVYE